VIPLAEHWDMFRMRFENPPERRLERIGEINVGHLQQIGRDYQQRIESNGRTEARGLEPGTLQRFHRGLPAGLPINCERAGAPSAAAIV